jgi:hypothetical protein
MFSQACGGVGTCGYLQHMKKGAAVLELETLNARASDPQLLLSSEALAAWHGGVCAALTEAFGSRNRYVRLMDRLDYSGGMGPIHGPRAQAMLAQARDKPVRDARFLIQEALHELAAQRHPEPVDATSFDPELWEHVKGLVDDEDWGKIASQAAIFVENHVRVWAGSPTDKKGEPLYSNVLWQKVLADDSELRLGQRAAEWQGWRELGIGFSLALRNVDLHRLQKREDAKRYAIGVLGLGSLLLTQLRYEHGDILNEG